MQKIVVKQFMALTGETTIELKNMLVIIGEQASGKSTLAMLLYYFRSLKQDFLSAVYNNLDTQEQIRSTFVKAMGGKFFNTFGTTRNLGNFEVTFYYSPSKYIQLSSDNGLNVNFSDTLKSAFFLDSQKYIDGMTSVASRKDVYETLAFQEAVKRTEKFVESIFEDNSQPLFIPAGRAIAITYSDYFKQIFFGEIKNDLDFINTFIHHVEKMTAIFAGYDDFQSIVDEYILQKKEVNQESVDLAIKKIRKVLRGEYKSDHNGEKIFFKEENFVLLNKASSGQQEIIRILQDIFLVILDQQKAFRVIEEPEAHLYPLAQKQVIEMIALMLNSTDSEIVITTHSPYVLSILNNLLFATRVAKKSESASKQTAKILDPLFWLDPDKCGVYAIKDGKCKSIFNIDNDGLIDQNSLDEISEELGADFDDLYAIYGSTTVK